MPFRYFLLFFSIFCFSFPLIGNTDSLRQALGKEKDILKRGNIFLALAEHFQTTHYDSSLYFSKKALDCFKKKEDKNAMALAWFNIGYASTDLGKYEEAKNAFLISMDLFVQVKDRLWEGKSHNDLGYVYQLQGNLEEALKHYKKALFIFEQIPDSENIAATTNNIGLLFHSQKDYKNAMQFYLRSAEIKKSMKNYSGLALAYNNIGSIYLETGQPDLALEPLNQALELRDKAKNPAGYAQSLINVGAVYRAKRDTVKALSFFLSALEIQRKMGVSYDLAINLSNIGNLYSGLNKHNLAIKYGTEGYELAKKIKSPELIIETSNTLYRSFKKAKKWEDALNYFSVFKAYSDSVSNLDRARKLTETRMQMEFESELRKKEFEEKEKDLRHQTQLSEQKTILISVLIGLVFLVGFSIFIYTRLRVISFQKKIIEEQKVDADLKNQIIELKNKDITDSIRYARRIQKAVLPPDNLIADFFKEAFIYYHPKDIVSGDFYWMERIGEKIYFAVADCTGHGVPGSFMSLVGSSLLNQAVKEPGIDSPDKILKQLNLSLSKALHQTQDETSIQDGMDISLCCYDPGNNLLTFSCSYQSVNHVSGEQLTVFMGDKIPIGAFFRDQEKSFTLHSIKPSKGDMLYLSTDGFPDQFGGPKGKKFKYKPFEKLLVEISSQPIAIQKNSLEETFLQWKGGLDQVDDICIMGLKF
jgi:tetratricopeptide (TPR) repeat protein/serine phosphatase RsbU (regulator of sigma subunit)